jgi:SHS2 domain-containing protein
MMHIIYGEHFSKCLKGKTETVTVSSNDQESLLVDWLSELLYRSDANDCAYTDFTIKTLTEKELTADVTTCAAQAVDDIKAVTYHGLKIEKENDIYHATVLFDV